MESHTISVKLVEARYNIKATKHNGGNMPNNNKGELWLEFFKIAVNAVNEEGTQGYEKAQAWLNKYLEENNLPGDLNQSEAFSQCREVVYWLEKFEENFICEKRADFENQKEG